MFPCCGCLGGLIWRWGCPSFEAAFWLAAEVGGEAEAFCAFEAAVLGELVSAALGECPAASSSFEVVVVACVAEAGARAASGDPEAGGDGVKQVVVAPAWSFRDEAQQG